MLPSFERAIFALGESIAWERHSDDDRCGTLGKNAAEFLLSVHRRMPDFLRPPFHLLVLLFDAWPLLRSGRPFHRLTPDQRLAAIEAWRGSSIEFQRRFVEFHTSLAVFGLYSDLYGQDYRYGDLASRERARH